MRATRIKIQALKMESNELLLPWDFERVLTAYLKLAFYKNWDYPVIKEEESDVQQGGNTC